MNINKYMLKIIFPLCFILLISCKKKYERPDQFQIDLFENERKKEDSIQLLTKEEELKLAEVIIKVDSIKLLDHNNNKIYVYQIISGKVGKGNIDSISFPLNILSTKEIQFNQKTKDLYLENIKSYKLLVKDFNINYQVIN
ncbi:hypothetical protein [Chishuiella sp.]|uniref:hypothetical protein n=1 Tax=Chishuiella sp. TaxID=1969467 RepID=UPI0028A87252|nr:hypothetical protein [Chishuiella sp.]